MDKSVSIPAVLLIYGICLPLAIFLGYMLATPTALTSFSVVSLVFFLLVFPLILKWHHAFLIFSWNSFLILFFLPGQLHLGVLMAFGTMLIAILNRTLRKQTSVLSVPAVSAPLIVMAAIVLATMWARGGFGARLLGSSLYGGKKYVLLLGAIIGYFAFVSQAIPLEKRRRMASFYFISGVTAALSDLAYLGGPAFYFLFALVSSQLASMQALSQENFVRFSGLTWGCLALCYFFLMRFGITGLFDLLRPWRLVSFCAVLGISLLGGFRSVLVILGILVIVEFYFEGLFKTKYLPIFAALAVVIGLLLVSFIDRMPLAVQRSVSFLPIHVDPVAKQDAISTLDWRFEIWRIVVPEIPTYFWLGKGFAFNGTDSYLTEEAMKRGFYKAYEDTLITGNYHSGILTTIIPFGIFGFLSFLWFCGAAIRVLYFNYKYGDPAIQQINRFLLVYFVGRLIFFLTLYGQLELDMMVFTGTVGLSVALNHGVCRPAEAPHPEPSETLALAPAT